MSQHIYEVTHEWHSDKLKLHLLAIAPNFRSSREMEAHAIWLLFEEERWLFPRASRLSENECLPEANSHIDKIYATFAWTSNERKVFNIKVWKWDEASPTIVEMFLPVAVIELRQLTITQHH